MIDVARLALVLQTSGQTADQSVAAVRGLQQQGSAIGTALPLIALPHGKRCLNEMFVAEEAFRAFKIMSKAGGQRD